MAGLKRIANQISNKTTLTFWPLCVRIWSGTKAFSTWTLSPVRQHQNSFSLHDKAHCFIVFLKVQYSIELSPPQFGQRKGSLLVIKLVKLDFAKQKKKEQKCVCIRRELNPGLPRGRRKSCHWTTDASVRLAFSLKFILLNT